MLVFLFVVASASMVLPVTNAVSNCSACELEGSYSQLNGYGCFYLNDGNVACTCPDQRYILNKPCRICERKNICGDDPNNICSDASPTSLGGNSSKYFACLCTDLSIHIGESCPPTTTTLAINDDTTITSAEPNEN